MATAVIDAPSVLHRTYHARGGWAGAEDLLGASSKVLAGVLGRARSAGWECEDVVASFDDRRRSRRRLAADWYKAGRSATPALLAEALDAAPDALRAAGVSVALAAGWEADDCCAAVVRLVTSQGGRCVVVSSDRDLLSLVGETVCVLSPAAGSRVLGVGDVRAIHGVDPGRYHLYAATRGDRADGVAGVPGLGPKRAALLWSSYASLEAVAADRPGVEDLLGARLAAVLFAHLDAVAANVELCRLRAELDVAAPSPLPECW